MNSRVPITFNQYPCYENIFAAAEWKSKFLLPSTEKKGELKKWPRKLKPQNEFDQNNDMQKYRIKNQFSVESFLILRLSISSFSLEPREISAIFFSLLFHRRR